MQSQKINPQNVLPVPTRACIERIYMHLASNACKAFNDNQSLAPRVIICAASEEEKDVSAFLELGPEDSAELMGESENLQALNQLVGQALSPEGDVYRGVLAELGVPPNLVILVTGVLVHAMKTKGDELDKDLLHDLITNADHETLPKQRAIMLRLHLSGGGAEMGVCPIAQIKGRDKAIAMPLIGSNEKDQDQIRAMFEMLSRSSANATIH